MGGLEIKHKIGVAPKPNQNRFKEPYAWTRWENETFEYAGVTIWIVPYEVEFNSSGQMYALIGQNAEGINRWSSVMAAHHLPIPIIEACEMWSKTEFQMPIMNFLQEMFSEQQGT